jgi:uncharacterized membrane protein YfcA
MTMGTGTLMLLLLAGVAIGVVGGMLGIGGGILVIPALVFLFGFRHEQAVGTSLGMLLPPIGIFAFLTYHRSGNVNLPAAGVLALGFAVGALLGAKVVAAGVVPDKALRLMFGLFLVYVAANMILRTERRTWALATGMLSVAVAGATFVLLRTMGKRLERRASLRDAFLARVEHPVAPDYEI